MPLYGTPEACLLSYGSWLPKQHFLWGPYNLTCNVPQVHSSDPNLYGYKDLAFLAILGQRNLWTHGYIMGFKISYSLVACSLLLFFWFICIFQTFFFTSPWVAWELGSLINQRKEEKKGRINYSPLCSLKWMKLVRKKPIEIARFWREVRNIGYESYLINTYVKF